ncbi:alpha/beta hydrolase [Solicola sp. PLA-1-18]|uniref:alpha/beta hydrolase n=1 Tax=Solicola sp. PLA-1-18 TaxID=3380532 RepID=UPI003B7CD40E
MALDDATQQYLDTMIEKQPVPTHELTPEQARANEADTTALIAAGPELARVEDGELVAQGGHTFRTRTFVPEGDVAAVIAFFQGGGWVTGTLERYDTVARELARRSGCAVVVVEYRKAPEFPFPAAVDDSWQALRWVSEHLVDIAGSRVPLVVAGDSAGGNLAAVMAMRARDTGEVQVAFQVLVYPVTNFDLDTRSYLEQSNQLMLRRETMAWYWDHYLPDADKRDHPDASPLQAPDRRNLPPAIVLLAEHDVLRNEGDAYADGLRRAGVAVEQRTIAGQMHGFFPLFGVLPGSLEAVEWIATEVQSSLDELDS